MGTSDSMEALLSALTHDMSDNEAVLSVLQSMIASEITIRRIKKNMSQKEFAALLGVSQSTLSKWESGETNFTLATLVNIAGKLGIEMQSPFVLTPPKAYERPTNIIVFAPPANSWSTQTYSERPVYSKHFSSDFTQEADEM